TSRTGASTGAGPPRTPGAHAASPTRKSATISRKRWFVIVRSSSPDVAGAFVLGMVGLVLAGTGQHVDHLHAGPALACLDVDGYRAQRAEAAQLARPPRARRPPLDVVVASELDYLVVIVPYLAGGVRRLLRHAGGEGGVSREGARVLVRPRGLPVADVADRVDHPASVLLPPFHEHRGTRPASGQHVARPAGAGPPAAAFLVSDAPRP